MRRLLRSLTILIICAAAGFVLAHYGTTRSAASPPALAGEASTAGYSVRYPSGWRVRSPGLAPHLPLGAMIELGPSPPTGGSSATEEPQLVIGTAHPAQPGTLVSTLRSRLAIVPSAQLVVLGASTFARYAGAVAAGQSGDEWIYLLPTSRSTITAVCSAPRVTVVIAAACERVLATLRPTGSVLSLATDPGYALELNHILADLDGVRRASGPALASLDPRVQAAAAARLGRAERRAATSANAIRGVAVSVANHGLVEALRRGSRAYFHLSAAALARNGAADVAAEGEVARAERAMTRAYRRVRELGYRIG
jgi:hypothetical protein